LGHLLAPALAVEVEEGAEGVEGFLHVWEQEPAGEGGEGEVVGRGEGGGVGALGERLQEPLLGLGERGWRGLEDE
jgi:hypothetical protein